MTADDLNAPLGQHYRKRRWAIPITTSQVIAGALALFLGVFVVWAMVGNNPFGGEPVAVAPIDPHTGVAVKPADGQPQPKAIAVNPDRYDGPVPAQGQTRPPPA